jgi:hypothetical protein
MGLVYGTQRSTSTAVNAQMPLASHTFLPFHVPPPASDRAYHSV